MKQLFFSAICAIMFGFVSNAQEVPAAKPQQTKEEKAAAQVEQEKTIFSKAKFNDADTMQWKTISKEMDGKSYAVRKDQQLSEEEKKTKLKELGDEKKSKLVEAVGEAKYNDWYKARREVWAAEKAEKEKIGN